MVVFNIADLRKPSEFVPEITQETRVFIQKMVAALKYERGVGLAAPQLGVHQRILLARIPGHRYITCLINPEIIKQEGYRYIKEKCLSLPGTEALVKRSVKVEVHGYNVDGKLVKLKAKRLMAQVLEHEIDHLNGILCIDRAVRSRHNGTS